jgi:predicted protein tyrosine phosphatase
LPDIVWADLILFMESKHSSRLKARFPEALEAVDLQVLDIEDNYRFMDTDLVDEVRRTVDPILEAYSIGLPETG